MGFLTKTYGCGHIDSKSIATYQEEEGSRAAYRAPARLGLRELGPFDKMKVNYEKDCKCCRERSRYASVHANGFWCGHYACSTCLWAERGADAASHIKDQELAECLNFEHSVPLGLAKDSPYFYGAYERRIKFLSTLEALYTIRHPYWSDLALDSYEQTRALILETADAYFWILLNSGELPTGWLHLYYYNGIEASSKRTITPISTGFQELCSSFHEQGLEQSPDQHPRWWDRWYRKVTA